MHALFNHVPEFLTLLVLEMILGIDNLIFVSIVCEKLPDNIRDKTRICGLSIALIMRFLMLFGASLILSSTNSFVTVLQIELSYRDAFMVAGGLFLIYKCAREIYCEIFPTESKEIRTFSGISCAIAQIVGIDLMLSLDSVISAVGITNNNLLIGLVFFIYSVVAVLISKDLGKIINKYGNFKIIALLFIGLLGLFLVLDGFDIKISHNYLYATLLFSMLAETINCLRTKP
ncbi:TerC family protein [Candidatus Anaplasma sp. TIGMIC]|uniref:TerC family protein n=1 Tax=Candidatus Anaplasma sp. TIGMIC TaxID=3020713 RepID=UPI00232D18D3|nr:TerC family protein [Candidatus Anaplasma sp. TIGMIC]MDB1135167.1 TerC family protein [Candidatus Anaplasma sp. TIGMIC]